MGKGDEKQNNGQPEKSCVYWRKQNLNQWKWWTSIRMAEVNWTMATLLYTWTVKTGEASIIPWGCIYYGGHGMGPLVILDGSVIGKKYKQMLQKHFFSISCNTMDTILQDDNTPVHRANLVTTWKRRQNLQCLEWPAQTLIQLKTCGWHWKEQQLEETHQERQSPS